MSLRAKILDMKLIPLTQGKSAMVDDGDYESLSKIKWHARFDGYNWYAASRVGGQSPTGGKKHMYMHSFIMRPPEGVEIDHYDRDGLNNQRHNLRIVLHSQNCRNRKVSVTNKSGYKGVSWKKHNKKWCSQIVNNGRVTHLGLFVSPKEAAIVYDREAVRLYGQFSVTNERLGLLADG